jgi:hypothetical protein
MTGVSVVAGLEGDGIHAPVLICRAGVGVGLAARRSGYLAASGVSDIFSKDDCGLCIPFFLWKSCQSYPTLPFESLRARL